MRFYKVFLIGLMLILFISISIQHPKLTTASINENSNRSNSEDFFVYLPIISRPYDCTNVSEVPRKECEALVALYHSTDGDDWTDNTNWLQNDTPCSWNGAFCDNGHVEIIFMHENNLDGQLPPEIGNLDHLINLEITDSHLSGPLPSEIGNMDNLENINLNQNDLTGPIPVKIGDLKNLETLILNGNQIDGAIPSEIGDITALKSISLNDNKLSGSVPAELGNLAELFRLKINTNELNGPLPQNLTNLGLESFSFHETGLCEPDNTKFQSWLDSIPNLTSTGILCD